MVTDHVHSLQLAWLADRFRAQATLGLHYYPDEADHARLEQLRRTSAELAGLVDGRDVNIIEACFARDKGIHTPKAAVAFHIAAADGDQIWRTAYLAPTSNSRT